MGTGAHRNAVPQATSSVNSVWSIGLASAQSVAPRRRGHRLLATRVDLSISIGQGSSRGNFAVCCWVHVWPGNYYTNLSPLEDEPPMKALFLGTLAASQAVQSSNSSQPTSVPKSLIATNQHSRLRRSPMRTYC
jgi:hypothetical protein